MKLIATCPQKVNSTEIAVLRVTFNSEEIFHIILLVCAVKQRIQLNNFAEAIYKNSMNID